MLSKPTRFVPAIHFHLRGFPPLRRKTSTCPEDSRRPKAGSRQHPLSPIFPRKDKRGNDLCCPSLPRRSPPILCCSFLSSSYFLAPQILFLIVFPLATWPIFPFSVLALHARLYVLAEAGVCYYLCGSLVPYFPPYYRLPIPNHPFQFAPTAHSALGLRCRSGIYTERSSAPFFGKTLELPCKFSWLTLLFLSLSSTFAPVKPLPLRPTAACSFTGFQPVKFRCRKRHAHFSQSSLLTSL